MKCCYRVAFSLPAFENVVAQLDISRARCSRRLRIDSVPGFFLKVTEAGCDGYGVKPSVVKRAPGAMTHLFTERELSRCCLHVITEYSYSHPLPETSETCKNTYYYCKFH